MAKEITTARERGAVGLRTSNARRVGTRAVRTPFDSMVINLYDGYKYEGRNERGERTVVEYTPNGDTEFRVSAYYASRMPAVSYINGERQLKQYLGGIGFRNGKMKG